MTSGGADEMKARMRTDLRAATKEGRPGEARLIRALIAAIDNAEAPALPAGGTASDQLRFQDRSAEIERLSLDRVQVRAVVMAEIEERENAAAGMDGLGRSDHAAALRAEAEIARRYTV